MSSGDDEPEVPRGSQMRCLASTSCVETYYTSVCSVLYIYALIFHN